MRRNERSISFNVDAYTARLIGRENVSKLEGAVLEIVKNAYDADAKVFCLYYSASENCIIMIDNGSGMVEEVLRDHWMTIGNSSKKATYKTAGNRIQTGAKGIGRFAFDRISDRCEMLTISEQGGLEWIVNWDDFDGNKNLSDIKAQLFDSDDTLLEYAHVNSWNNQGMAKRIGNLDLGNTGTVFRLYGLHDDWNEKTMERLRNHLETLLPPDVVQDFDIYFFDDTTLAEMAKVVSANIDSYDYRIKFVVQGDRLSLYLNRNEFDFGEEEEKILREAGIAREEIPYFHGETKQMEFTFAEIGETANLIGDYKGVLYFNKITYTKNDAEKFYYKDIKGRKNFTREFGGIKIYRDHFRVRPYGEYGDNDFDWLELSARSSRSSVGLGHPRNNWRVGSEQMIGLVNISRENSNLEDAANRNGIQEGPGFEQLKKVLIAVISEFERDRQGIGRKLAEYARQKDELQAELEKMQLLAEERKKWEEQQKNELDRALGREGTAPVADPGRVLNLLSSYGERQEQEIQELENEIKMLNTLATTGIIANMFMHEIRTLTNNIGQELDSAYEAIKYDQDIEEAFRNIQKAIVFKKHFASWFGVTIESIRKDKRRRKCCNIKELLNVFMGTWEEILERNDVRLVFSCDADILFRCFAFDIENVISNLISNSLVSFERENDEVLNEKEIRIKIEKREEGFILYYEDTGWGLTPKYKKRPELILEAFESDRGIPGESKDEDGTGMGMWIVNRTILEYNGDIDLSENKMLSKGFKANVSFGGKYV
ncbi:MAG: GHKL domain-containing protein [Eubacterium sp.]|nr:GHKL domain-containing protein [Eubacterium sp.]